MDSGGQNVMKSVTAVVSKQESWHNLLSLRSKAAELHRRSGEESKNITPGHNREHQPVGNKASKVTWTSMRIQL